MATAASAARCELHCGQYALCFHSSRCLGVGLSSGLSSGLQNLHRMTMNPAEAFFATAQAQHHRSHSNQSHHSNGDPVVGGKWRQSFGAAMISTGGWMRRPSAGFSLIRFLTPLKQRLECCTFLWDMIRLAHTVSFSFTPKVPQQTMIATVGIFRNRLPLGLHRLNDWSKISLCTDLHGQRYLPNN